MIIDRQNNALIIADIDCARLVMHRDGTLYVSDCKKNEVKRWKKGEGQGTVVAGGSGQGNGLNQLYAPTSIFVTDDHTLYISDTYNHRVMKWLPGSKAGIVVAGGNDAGNLSTQLSCPHGVIVDQFDQIYVADCGNNRIMRWCEGNKEGMIVVGGNGGQADQLSSPRDLSFDNGGNLYIADCGNHRIQKFDIDRTIDQLHGNLMIDYSYLRVSLSFQLKLLSFILFCIFSFMAASSNRTIWDTEDICQKFSEGFSLKDFAEQLDQIESDHGRLREDLNKQRMDPTKHPVMGTIDQWESESIDKIRKTAEECRGKWIEDSHEFHDQIEKKLNDLARRIKELRDEQQGKDMDLENLRGRLQKLREELVQPENIRIQRQSTPFIDKISLSTASSFRWQQIGKTIAGGTRKGNGFDQLSLPHGICIDEHDQTVYIADFGNHRIVEWKANDRIGRVVAGGTGQGDHTNQLNSPADVILDRKQNALIIADWGNRRVIRCSRQSSPDGEILIEDIYCHSLAMHKDGALYVSDCERNLVRRWKKGETEGTIVAGGNGTGKRRNQLDFPTYICVDDDHTLYISDRNNERVMKWVKDAKEGIVVAGGKGQGSNLMQFAFPQGVKVDPFGQIYVADYGNGRITRWSEETAAGTVVVDGKADRLCGPRGLAFGGEGNLYVADCENHRIQKYTID